MLPARYIELHYNVRVAQGHRFAKDVTRPWPINASLGDVMAELTTELESLGCSDITVTKADRPALPVRRLPKPERPPMGNGPGFGGRSFDDDADDRD